MQSDTVFISRWRFLLRRLTRQLWFRATLIALLAVVAAWASFVIAPYLPSGLSATIGADSVDRILQIIASSMLAVTTFSLSTMVAAYSAATSNVTPRATRLLIEDTESQNMLAAFVGSFLYSLVAIITLSMGAYGERGRVVLFAVTILVILIVVGTLLRWIDYVSKLGRVGETTEQVEHAATDAMRGRFTRPFLGGLPLADPVSSIPDGAMPIFASVIGYVQHVDMGALSEAARSGSGAVYLVAPPGTFVDAKRPVAWCTGLTNREALDRIRTAVTIDDERSFDQDPRFGLSVLAEIACRALSPGINDPGTAIDVVGRAVRVLSIWADPDTQKEPIYPEVHVTAITADELFDDVFMPIARDGAGIAEVQIRLQKALAALARLGRDDYREAAIRQSRHALARAEAAMAFEGDIARVKAAAEAVGG